MRPRKVMTPGAIVAELLTEMNLGQGEASVSCTWDSATSPAIFSVIAYRERDGEKIEKTELAQSEFVELVDKLYPATLTPK